MQVPTPTPTPKPVSCLLAHLMHASTAWVAPRPVKPAVIPNRIGSGPARRVCGYAGPGQMRCMAWKRTDATLSPAVASGYGPADLQAAYSLPSNSNGIGQTVAIVDAFDDPKAESDLAVYRSTFALPPCTTANGCFLKVNQSGATSPLPPTDPSSCSSPQGCWEEEEALDIDMVSAVCPNCHIVLIEADGQNGGGDLYVAENTAAQKCAATEISNSWNGSEYALEKNDDVNFDHPGIPITFASGDSGYPGGYPTASTFVTAVGGTTLKNAGLPTQTETTWNSSGALCSQYIAQPSWQANVPTVVNNPGVCTMRINNDVAAVGDPGTPVAVYTTYGGDKGWLGFGGTSVATPIIASVYALAGNGASINDGSYSYSHKTSLTDIIAGSITPCSGYSGTYICNSNIGYDGPTGNGSPNGIGGF
ncbi:MAG: peptidase S8 [Candidatus Eremiobacteraeota bacterium]|nr:peptidase S8 [Candidatus Eremiobacteraeota bacterium]